jgi:hypothetical protein
MTDGHAGLRVVKVLEAAMRSLKQDGDFCLAGLRLTLDFEGCFC